jgi:hypothetical protein
MTDQSFAAANEMNSNLPTPRASSYGDFVIGYAQLVQQTAPISSLAQLKNVIKSSTVPPISTQNLADLSTKKKEK